MAALFFETLGLAKMGYLAARINVRVPGSSNVNYGSRGTRTFYSIYCELSTTVINGADFYTNGPKNCGASVVRPIHCEPYWRVSASI
jgi:hypothetical protein